MNLSPLYWWREIMSLRRCDNEAEFSMYCSRKLKTPEKVRN